MTIKVSPTIFETAPNKKLAAVDVYKDTVDNTPINLDVIPPKDLEVGGPKAMIPNITNKLFGGVTNGIVDTSLNIDDAINNMGSIIDDPKDFIRGVGDNVLGDVLKSVGYNGSVDGITTILKEGPNTTNILNAVGAHSEELRVVIDNVTTVVDKADMDSLTGIMSAVSEITGNDDIMKIANINPQMAMVKGFVDKAMQIGVPEAVDALTSGLDSIEDVTSLKLFSTLNAATHGNLDYIATCIADENIGAAAIKATYPNIVTTILNNYVSDNNQSPMENSDKLVNVLDTLDNEWLEYNRDGNNITDLTNLVGSSKDAINVLKANVKTMIPALNVQDLNLGDAVEDTLNMRKYTPVSFLTQT